MERTGESYTTARRHIIQHIDTTSKEPWHFPGSIPGVTALRSLLAEAGVRDPRTRQPFSESMLFGLAGGIGIFTFCYEKEDLAPFFIAGRHSWQDELTYFTNALGRFGIRPKVRESSSPKAAEKALRGALADGSCIAWVDMAGLPHRAMPSHWSGAGYYIVAVYRMDDDGNAMIGDLADEPIAVPMEALTAARKRIQKDKCRLLSIGSFHSPIDLPALIRDGLQACHRGLMAEGAPKFAQRNFSLDSLKLWAEVFKRGHRLWSGLISMVQFVEHWSGGGLGRPMFVEFLAEAATVLSPPRLHELAKRYNEIGRGWSELADAALPQHVSALAQARELYARIGESTNSGAPEQARAAWEQFAELGQQAKKQFPLSEAECEKLRGDLQRRVQTLHAEETAAHKELGRIIR